MKNRQPRTGVKRYYAGAAVLAAGGILLLSSVPFGGHEAPVPASTFSASDPDTASRQETPVVEGTRVVIPSLDIAVAWRETGIADTGIMDIPLAPTAGWYDQSSVPGSAEGTAVIAAHVDYPDQALTPFGRLAEIQKGASVFVADQAGAVHEYRVISRETFNQQLLPDRIFTRAGDPLLVMVTCSGKAVEEPEAEGGQWGYQNNLVVTAELVSA